jgi:hypothetical protein
MSVQQETIGFWIISGTAALGMYVVGIFVGDIEEISLHFNWLVFGFQVFYLIISFRSQKQNEIGGKLFFGRFIQETHPGPVIAWVGIVEHRTEDASPQNTECPKDLIEEGVIEPEDAERDRVEDGGDGVDHYRMTHKGSNGTSSNDPLDQGRLTTKVRFVISWKIVDVRKFLTNAVNRKKFLRQLEDSAAGETRKSFKEKTAAGIITDWTLVEDKTKKALEDLVDDLDFGVDIGNFGIKKIDLTHEINTAFSNQIASGINIQTEKNKGEAKKAYDELAALGEKALRKAALDAEAEGFENIAKRLGLEKHTIEILRNQMVRDALQKANFNLITDGGALGLVGTIQQALEATKTQASSTTTTTGGSE